MGKINENKTENILVKVDQNNLIYIDPNSVVVDGEVQSRNIQHENLVMYVNLEADLIPRTTLIANGSTTSFTSIAKGVFNMMKSQNGDFDSSWTESYVSPNNNEELSGFEQSFGIDSININIKGGNFIPQININFVDVRGKTLFESPENSPYKSFFHLPWPIFYLTIKGFYGKAIRYRLHLVKFTSKYNGSNGNFEISTTFVGSTYAFLNDIPLMGILNAPFMYLSEKDGTTTFNESTGNYEKIINKTSKGYILLESVYNEYKEKGYLSKDFPVRTLREVIVIANSLDRILEREILDQKVDMRIFAGIKEFEDLIVNFENYVESWGKRFLSGEVFTIDNLECRLLNKTEKNLLTNVKGEKNQPTLENGIKNYIDLLNKTQLFANNLIDVTSTDFKKFKLSYNNKIENIDYYIKKQNNLNYGIAYKQLINSIREIQSSFINERDILIDKIQEEINKIIRDKEKGLGFDPTIKNIFAVILANAEVYIRLLSDVHRKSFDVGSDRAKKIGKLSDETIGEDIFPWPEIKKQTSSTKQKILVYPGDSDVKNLLDSTNPLLWPEIEFVENYHAVSTKTLDTLSNKEGSVGKINYHLPKDIEKIETDDISTFNYIDNVTPYHTKTVSSILYEIWERTKYATTFDSFNNETIKQLVKIEFDNIQNLLIEDFDIIDILKNVSSQDKFVSFLQSYSPYERYPYFKEQLPTTTYIKNVLNYPFFIEQNSNVIKKNEKNVRYDKLENNLKNYNVEDYRRFIYPFNSTLYQGYVNNRNENFNFNGLLTVKTSDGLISSTLTEGVMWVKPQYKNNIFEQTLNINQKNDEHILNTPYFHKQLFNDFNKQSSYGKYVGSAYLLLNSLPFYELSDTINETPISTIIKEIGSSHKIPYHLIIKWGSIYHRYKNYLLNGNDILSGFTTSNVTQPIIGNVFYDVNENGDNTYNVFDYTTSTNKSVIYNDNKDIGFHPFYMSIFNQIINDYGIFNVNNNVDLLNKTTNGSVYIRIRKHLDNKNYFTSFANNSKYKTVDNYYTILPSDGNNLLSNFNSLTYNNNIQSNFRIILNEKNQNVVYDGLTFPSYNEYNISQITDSINNGTYCISNEYRKIVDLISVFSPDILNEFEQYFLEFSSERIVGDKKRFSEVKHTNFQDLLKSIVTIDKNNINSTDFTTIINDLKKYQNNNLLNITSEILSQNNLLKITLANPKEIDPYTWGGFSIIDVDNTFTYDNYQSSQITDNKKYLKLYVGDDDEGEMYNKFIDFFNVNDIELSVENILQFRPLVLIYAGYIKNNGENKKTSFQEYIRNNVFLKNDNVVSGAINRHSLFLTMLTSLFPSLKSNVKINKLTIDEGFNQNILKLELYNYFKIFNDRWIAGNSIGQRLLIEEFLFLDKANKDIGDVAYIGMDRLSSLDDKGNEKQNLYGVISLLIQGTGFDMRALPSYVNFYGNNFKNKTKIQTSNNVASNLFGTFLDVDYQDSMPKIILQYTGPTSKHLQMKDVYSSKQFKNNGLFKDDSLNIGDTNNNPLIITTPQAFNLENLHKSNKVVAFEVNIGDQYQSIFKTVQLDQTSIKNTSESFVVYENLGRSETGSSAQQVDIGLFDIYRQASYSCTVTCMGNVMIQPTMFFYLKNVPLFRGSYWITEVSHNIVNNTINTTFTGTRIPYTSLPDPKESFMASYRVLFDKITNKAISRQKENDLRLNSSTSNETKLILNDKQLLIDMGNININGEEIIKETGTSLFGVNYNGTDNEKYIQKVKINNQGEYFRAIITIIDKKYPLNNDLVMNLFNKSQNAQLISGNEPNRILWSDIKQYNDTNDFYFLRFNQNVLADKILSAKTTFYNPLTYNYSTNDFNNKITISPFITDLTPTPSITPSILRGPICSTIDINNVGISLSSSLARKLKIDEGNVVYFNLE